MHASSMFANRQAQVTQVDVYDINQIAGNFNNWNFGIGDLYDRLTPKLCLLTIQEIQTHAQKGHPLRVGMFNMISGDGFNNPMFQDLMYTIIMRMGHGITNNEFRNIDMAAGTVIARAVKSCGCAMASEDPEFMNTMSAADQAAVRENADVWNYLVALAQGQAQFIPFASMGGTGLSGVSTSTQTAMQDARALRGATAGGFVENYEGNPNSRHNNNGGQAVGRYGRRSEKIHGKLEGSLQESLNEVVGNSTMGGQREDPVPQDTGYKSRLKRPSATAGGTGTTTAPATNPSFAAAAAKKFDSDVTDFSKTIATAPVAAEAPEVAKSMFTVQLASGMLEIMRERKEGFSAWKSSHLQRFHPAYCKRTWTVRYFESREGFVIAILGNLDQQQKEIAMNYDTHAVDPTKGQPDPIVPVRPVREEAKVMYSSADKVQLNITVAKAFGMEEDVTGAIRSARLAAEMSDVVPQALIRMSLVNAPIVYPTAEDAAEDAILLRAISNSKTFIEAAEYLPKVRNEMARQVINKTLVKAINRTTTCEIGVGVRIGDFIEDGPAIVKFLTDKQGALIGEKMAAYQTTILQANVRVIPATDESMRAYADATLSQENEDTMSETMASRVLFLQHNVCAVWVDFNDDEMAIALPPKGAASIESEALGAVFKIAETVYKEAIGSMTCSEQYLITKDSVCYNLHRGLINKNTYMISKKID